MSIVQVVIFTIQHLFAQSVQVGIAITFCYYYNSSFTFLSTGAQTRFFALLYFKCVE